ncbi:MAG TPA: MMPL family transporter [Candidatus Dormibacteraeota bacterium]|nr:MMPL family transporter [Candidatus Dormibacteraeota bacterium]
MHASSASGGPFRWLARFALRRSGLILAVCAVVLVAGGLVLLRGGRLSAGTTEGIESDIAQRIIEEKLAYPGDSSFIILFRARELAPGNPRFSEALRAALAPLRADPRVRAVLAPDDAPPLVAERLLSPAARSALAVVSLRHDFSVAAEEYPELRELVRSPDFDVGFTGNLAFRYDLNETNRRDLLFAELLSLPLAMLVLLVVFRSAAAAAVSVGIGALAVTTGVAIVTALSHVMDLSVYSVNVASLVGLGVAIDYSLFIVSRYRDELADGATFAAALETAMDTSGRAVVFSGIAVAIGLGSLLFFRGSFLAGMGVAAGIVVVLAILAALTFLPALLVWLGPRIDAGRLPLPRLIDTAGMWHRLATWVMQRPVLVLLPTLAFLIALGLPFVRLTMAAADVQTLPRGVAARDVYEQLRLAFPDQAHTRIQVVFRFPDGTAYTPERVGQIYDLAQRYRQLPGVVKFEGVVDSDDRLNRDYFTADAEMPDDWLPPDALKMRSMVAADGVALLTLLTDAAPASRVARDIVRTIRRDPHLGDGVLLITGATAHDLDISEFTLSRAPWAIGFIIIVTGAALFILLRSVVLPLKAVVMNLLSITASFGALVWIFEDGHFVDLLHFEAGPIDPTVPTLLFCTVFGLSMDYEVLMLSRMREEYLRTGDNTWAVAEGLERTGRLVTSAAAIMVVVFAAFGLASVVVVKAIGISLALAVALDATLVRCLIVPATMRLFGDWNWWAPRWLGGAGSNSKPIHEGTRTAPPAPQ